MKLNIEKINCLADRIEQCVDVEPGAHSSLVYNGFKVRGFTMHQVHYPCGAPACLMGHNAAMHGRTGPCYLERNDIAKDLGITEDQADELCAPEHSEYAHYCFEPGTPGFITKQHAVSVLRNLADTGAVDWNITATGGKQP